MLIFMFPGQNSRYPGMIRKFASASREGAGWVERASAALHRNLAAHFREGNAEQFARNRDVQVGVFLASHLLLAALQSEGIDAHYSLGLSLGEYNHLVHIGALSFEDALRLLEARGDAYDTSPEGAMVSVAPVGLAEAEMIAVVNGLDVALHNTPRQQVLSGARHNLDAALKQLDFIQPVFIEQRLAMHSRLFQGVADRLRPALEAVQWRKPFKPYLPNTLGKFIANPAPADFIDLLTRHVHCPVLWRESMETMASTAPMPAFVEVGPRTVLHNMIGRRWLDYPRYKTDGEENFQAAFEALIEELKVGQRDAAIADPRRQARPSLATGTGHAIG